MYDLTKLKYDGKHTLLQIMKVIHNAGKAFMRTTVYSTKKKCEKNDL